MEVEKHSNYILLFYKKKEIDIIYFMEIFEVIITVN